MFVTSNLIWKSKWNSTHKFIWNDSWVFVSRFYFLILSILFVYSIWIYIYLYEKSYNMKIHHCDHCLVMVKLQIVLDMSI